MWEFNCPQFGDFKENDDANVESYFEIDHENSPLASVAVNKQNGAFGRSFKGKKSDIETNQKTKTEKISVPSSSSKKPNANQLDKQKDYTLRLTPFRKARSKSYCSVYQSNGDDILGLEKKSRAANIKSYDLRVTPARETRTKSCFMFQKLDLEDDMHNIKHCYVSSELSVKKVDDSLANSYLPPVEMAVTPRSLTEASTSVAKSRESNSLKRSSSPGSNDFPVKRARYTLHGKSGNIRKQDVKSGVRQKPPEQVRKDMLLKARQKTAPMRKAPVSCSSTLNEISTFKCTVVKPFHFETDGRIKNCRNKEEHKKMDFISSLRRNSPRLMKTVCKITKTEPFNFTQIKKRKVEVDQKCEERRKESSKIPMQPCTPKLLALKRNRRVSYISKETKEDLEVLEMKKWKFHAKPYNPTVFTHPTLPKIEHKPPTKAERKSLATEKRFQSKEPNNLPENNEKFEFHAQPFPKKIFLTPGVNGIKPRNKLQPTEPKSPPFALKTRSQKWKEHASAFKEQIEKEKPFKAKPVPEFQAPPSIKADKRCTTMEPFSFDENDKLRQNKKQQKILEEIEKDKQMARFKANPLPPQSSGPADFHKVAKKTATKSQPFNFQIAQIASENAAKWQKEMENQLAFQKKSAVFKAHPASVLKNPPFLPEKSSKPLTTCNTFHLSTERRASEWAKFEECTKTKQAENDAKLLLLQAEKEKVEKEEIAQLRKESVHRANPVRHYKTLELKPSEKPVTTPVSPCFATKLRARERI